MTDRIAPSVSSAAADQTPDRADRSGRPDGGRQVEVEKSCAEDEPPAHQEQHLGDFLKTPIFVLHDDLGEQDEGHDDRERLSDSGTLQTENFDSCSRAGPYQLIRPLGTGGMGTVYLGRRADDEYRREVAVKVIRQGPESSSLLRRFLMERQILADLKHPNIAELYDGGTIHADSDIGDADDAGTPYFVMELIDGDTITAYCDREQLGIEDRVELFRDICAGVQAAHRNLIVHRDIKPGNILVTSAGVPKLLDFGIAKPLDPSAFPHLAETTGPWQRAMTPVYASPEQIRGEKITTATDVYSLGVVLYELLTGLLPYRPGRDECHSIEDAILNQRALPPSRALSASVTTSRTYGEPSPSSTPDIEQISRSRGLTPQQLRRSLTEDLDNIVMKALRKSPNRRYLSVEQLAEDLRRYRMGMPVVARKDTAGYRFRKFIQRNRLGVSSAVVVTFMIVGFAIAMTLLAARLRVSDRTNRGLAERAASLAQDLSTALDEKQREEVQRKQAEAEQLKLKGESRAADILRADIAEAEAELAARTLALEELRNSIGSQTAVTTHSPTSKPAQPEETEQQQEVHLAQQLEETRETANTALGERDSALARAMKAEQKVTEQNQLIADATTTIERLESRLAAVQTLEQPAEGQPCTSGLELEDQGFIFVRICPSTSTIGSPSRDRLAYEDEYPAHEVTLSEYWIGKFEVDNQQFRRVHADHQGDASLPVSTVSWTQARKFCKHFGFDLPTEAEWEVAARAGTDTPWFFGDSQAELDLYAWHEGNSSGVLHPIGQKLPNSWGIHDMYGNVWEWVADMWSPYVGKPAVDPRGPPVTPGSRRVVRGGAFDDGPRLLRSAFRGGAGPVFRRRDVGFRCVRRPVLPE